MLRQVHKLQLYGLKDVAGSATRDIIVYSQPGVATRVQYYYGCYDPLQYPILFPLGESGWHQGIKIISSVGEDRANAVDSLPHISNIHTVDQLLIAEASVYSPNNSSQGFISCHEYYCYKLQIRLEDRCFLLHCGRIFQQYVVDMYIKLESSRLEYFRHNKKRIRAEVYSGIVDSIAVGEKKRGQGR